jgi:hypothetical protein
MTGAIMSHEFLAIPDIQQEHPREFFQQYLYNSDEPPDDESSDLPPKLEAELLENSYSMKRRLRHLAQRMRKNYS